MINNSYSKQPCSELRLPLKQRSPAEVEQTCRNFGCTNYLLSETCICCVCRQSGGRKSL